MVGNLKGKAFLDHLGNPADLDIQLIKTQCIQRIDLIGPFLELNFQ